jgi:hypothetical protein
MSLEAVMDAVAVRLAAQLSAASDTGTPGLRAAYSAASTTQGAAIIPRSIDNWPIAIVWAAGGELTAGNGPEPMLHRLEVRIWCNATEAAFAYQTLIPFVERCRVLFRTDLHASIANVSRLLMLGYDEPEVDDAHGKPFLVLPIYLEALEMASVNTYSVDP